MLCAEIVNFKNRLKWIFRTSHYVDWQLNYRNHHSILFSYIILSKIHNEEILKFFAKRSCLPLNSSILSWERSHLSMHVVRPRWSKEVKLDTFGQNSPTHPGNGQISHSPSRSYAQISGFWPGWRGAVDVEGSSWWAINLWTVSCSILLLDVEADVDVMSGWLLKDRM